MSDEETERPMIVELKPFATPLIDHLGSPEAAFVWAEDDCEPATPESEAEFRLVCGLYAIGQWELVQAWLDAGKPVPFHYTEIIPTSSTTPPEAAPEPGFTWETGGSVRS